MKGTLFLYVAKDTTSYGGTEKMNARVSTLKDTPKPNEVQFKLSVDIPNELFEKPMYEAQISIAKSSTVKKDAPKLELTADAVELWLEAKEEKK